MENSLVLKKEEHRWMIQVMDVVRSTSLFFQPQIRTKIMNEGWASFWHERLFLQDDRISGHEVDYARVNASVTALPRVGLNPYALGMRLFEYIEELGNTGKYSYDFKRLLDSHARLSYDRHEGKGLEFIFKVRETLCDFLFLYNFLDQEFIDRHQLFVAGRRLNQERMVWEYFIKSRRVEDYREMIFDTLYHPPHITIDMSKTTERNLYLVHHFEGKPLVTEYISNTMMGIEFLWGSTVQLETSEVITVSPPTPQSPDALPDPTVKPEFKWRRVVYTMKERKIAKRVIGT
jgi:stage V sporulation protein R